jgi:DNA polymerase elongation subunit (family B)
MKAFDHRKEEIEAMPAEEQAKPEIAAEYADVVFNKNYLNSKQNALKVFMNTFYGETGNQQSSLFDVVISGGTTAYG